MIIKFKFLIVFSIYLFIIDLDSWLKSLCQKYYQRDIVYYGQEKYTHRIMFVKKD
jgi:hypothetical protein